MRTRLARDRTRAAHNTLVGRVKKLGLYRFRLGVMTPSAIQGTALEKYGRPDTRAVVYTEFLNVENSSFHFYTTYQY
jgi:hypothetical protein